MAEPQPRPAWRRGLLTGAVSLSLLTALAWRLDTQELRALIGSARWPWILAAAALGPLQVVLASERWYRASLALDAPLGRRRAVAEYALSTLLNQLLPGGIAGDALRVLRQRRHGLGTATRAALVDRGLGQVGLAVLVGLGLLLWPGRPAGTLILAGAVATALVVVALLARETVARAVLPQLGAHAALSLTLLGSFLLGFALCGQALGIAAGPWLWCAIPLVLLAMSLPLSWGGWGPRELTAAALLPAFGMTSEQGVALSAMYGLSVLLGALPGALVPILGDRLD